MAQEWSLEPDWRSPASQDAGVALERLVDAEGNPWTPGQRAYDRETGRMCQTGLVQQAEQALATWAAPRTSDTNGPGHHGDGAPDLRTQAHSWSAPQASDGEKGGPNQSFGAGGVPLTTQAVAFEQGPKDQWMTPMTADDGRKVTHATKQYSLIQQGERDFFLPPSSPDRPIAAGAMCSTDSPNSNQPSVRRKLNPIFVEALMRWPTGLSGFERQEMASIRWWLLSRSYLSALVSQKPEPKQASLF